MLVSPYTIAFPDHYEMEGLRTVHQQWVNLADTSSSMHRLYQSPLWWNDLRASKQDGELLAGLVRDRNGRLIGVAPLQLHTHFLTFEVAARPLWKTPVRSVSLLGSQPLLPEDDNAYAELFRAIWETFPNCDGIYMDSLPTDSFCWRFLGRSAEIQKHSIVHLSDGLRPHHVIDLPDSFPQYVSQFSPHGQRILRQRVRQLRERAGGRLDLVRVETDGDAAVFLDAAKRVARNSWQHRRIGPRLVDRPDQRERLIAHAASGLLRCYLLRCAKTPCAYLVGYQFGDVFHAVETCYDQAFSKSSPGTVLLYLMIEDLITRSPARTLDFGVGDSAHKRRFANRQSEDAAVWVFRKTLVNRLRIGSHTAFHLAVRGARAMLRRGALAR